MLCEVLNTLDITKEKSARSWGEPIRSWGEPLKKRFLLLDKDSQWRVAERCRRKLSEVKIDTGLWRESVHGTCERWLDALLKKDLSGEMLRKKGQLEKAWGTCTHPELIRAFLDSLPKGDIKRGDFRGILEKFQRDCPKIIYQYLFEGKQKLESLQEFFEQESNK